MWENVNTDVYSLEDFKEYIWKYWVEYYFKDDRYVRVDNKALISVWSRWSLETAFGGTDGAKEAVAFMNVVIKKYGYDGVVLITGAGPNGVAPATYGHIKARGIDG